MIHSCHVETVMLFQHLSLFSLPHPFSLSSLLSTPSLQMTRVSYPVCLIASVCGLLPTQMLNTYMGSTVRNMQEVLADRVDGYIILSAQISMSIFLMLYLLRKARSELAKLTKQVDVESGNAPSSSSADR